MLKSNKAINAFRVMSKKASRFAKRRPDLTYAGIFGGLLGGYFGLSAYSDAKQAERLRSQGYSDMDALSVVRGFKSPGLRRWKDKEHMLEAGMSETEVESWLNQNMVYPAKKE